METKIKLKKENVLKVPIYDEEDNFTGNYLEFDLEDIELPLKWQSIEEEHKKNLNFLKMNFALAEKKPEKKGKKMLTSVEEEKFKILKEFYQKEIETLDIVLGSGGTAKLLNGRSPYYQMFNDIMEYLEPLTPYFEEGFKKAQESIIKKYSIKETDTIEG